MGVNEGDFQSGGVVQLPVAFANAGASDRLRQLYNFAQSDVTAYPFQAMADAVLSKHASASALTVTVSEFVKKTIAPFLDSNGSVASDIVAIIEEHYPSAKDLHSRDPSIAKRYSKLPDPKSMYDQWIMTHSTRPRPSKASIPPQEQRWAFLRNVQEALGIQTEKTQPGVVFEAANHG